MATISIRRNRWPQRAGRRLRFVLLRGSAEQALAEEGLQPVQLGAKDGLCLVNGTPCMTGLSCLALADAHHLLQWADVIGAMSFEAQRGQIDAFDEEIIALKPHPGMQQVGINLRALLDGSEVIASSKGIRTQDALSIRSIPQIHGAARDQVEHATRQIETELKRQKAGRIVRASAALSGAGRRGAP